MEEFGSEQVERRFEGTGHSRLRRCRKVRKSRGSHDDVWVSEQTNNPRGIYLFKCGAAAGMSGVSHASTKSIQGLRRGCVQDANGTQGTVGGSQLHVFHHRDKRYLGV